MDPNCLSLTVVSLFREVLGVEPVQQVFVHEPHVGVVLQAGVQLVIAVEVLSRAQSVAHEAGGLAGH